MKRLLMVAYHFPPLAGSSGIQRTLRFVQQLPQFGWQPLVLSINPRAYEHTSTDLVGDIPSGTVVARAFGLDAARHLALGGRYLAASARPDRWMTWKFDAVRIGLGLIRRHRPAAIWSTYPIATAHLIGAELQRRTGLPWLADFRDPMAQDGYPSDPEVWRSFKAIEERAAERASYCMFTTPSAASQYRHRYPTAAAKMVLLENGFDEESFAAAEAATSDRAPLNPGMVTLLHSGIVYPSERDPSQLFAALGRLRLAGRLAPGHMRIRFRAAVHDDLLQTLATQHGVADLIETLPPIPYREALREMMRADALLVMQGRNCNEQVPAKVYEYMRAGRPVLCLADPAGDTATVVRGAGVTAIVALESSEGIMALLPAFLDTLAEREGKVPLPDAVSRASRLNRTAELARRLESLPPDPRVFDAD